MAGNGNGKTVEGAAPKRYSLSRAEREWLKANASEGQSLAEQMQSLQQARNEVVAEIVARLGLTDEVAKAATSANFTPDFSTLVVGELRLDATAQSGTAKVIDMPTPMAEAGPAQAEAAKA